MLKICGLALRAYADITEDLSVNRDVMQLLQQGQRLLRHFEPVSNISSEI